MGEFHFAHVQASGLCVTSAGDVQERHIGKQGFDLKFEYLDCDSVPKRKRFRLILGGGRHNRSGHGSSHEQ